jgi:hypothetical protein
MNITDDQRGRGKLVLAQLFAFWDEHAIQYNGVIYRAALVRSDGVWQPAVLWICPQRRSGAEHEAQRADYGDLLIVRGCFSLVLCWPESPRKTL